MMRSRAALLPAWILVCCISSWLPLPCQANAFMPEEEHFDAPSPTIRGALKQAMVEDYEDVIVMQQEMAWGAQEMKRYKTLRGEWPVRSELEGRKGSKSPELGGDDGPKDIFGESVTMGPGGESDYWTYLISIF